MQATNFDRLFSGTDSRLVLLCVINEPVTLAVTLYIVAELSCYDVCIYRYSVPTQGLSAYFFSSFLCRYFLADIICIILLQWHMFTALI